MAKCSDGSSTLALIFTDGRYSTRNRIIPGINFLLDFGKPTLTKKNRKKVVVFA
jgi:hypothetical protein